MKALILGGTRFVGRTVVETMLAAGDQVTTLSTGTSPVPSGVTPTYADRRDPASMAAALGRGEWDLVVDTWAGEPRFVTAAVDLLADRVGHWTYVSSRSVYQSTIRPGLDESAPTVAGDPDSDDTDYASAKRGGELAAQRHQGPVLISRPGLIIGPYENIGRLPFWLKRIAAGGRVPVPGPTNLPVQLLDARDLAEWIRRCALAGIDGEYNLVSAPGSITFGEVIQACHAVTNSVAELVWVTPEQVAAAGVEPWGELPFWLPPGDDDSGIHDCDISAALAAGFTPRPILDTVADTWSWLQLAGTPEMIRPGIGYDDEATARLLGSR